MDFLLKHALQVKHDLSWKLKATLHNLFTNSLQHSCISYTLPLLYPNVYVCVRRLKYLSLSEKERNLRIACISHLHFDYLTGSCI